MDLKQYKKATEILWYWYKGQGGIANIALTTNPLSQFAPTTLAQLNSVISDANITDHTGLYSLLGHTHTYSEITDFSAGVTSAVDKTFVDALNIDSDTLDGQQGTYYLDFNNFTNTPTTFVGYGLSGTKAQFDAALSDGSFVFQDDANITNWNTAYGWGDHATGGYEVTSNRGAANGYTPLGADSKIPTTYLPALAITDTFVVAAEVSMLSLNAQTGDVAVRTDENKSYILQGPDPLEIGDWQELLTPTDTILSVNGLTGAVQLDLGFTPGTGVLTFSGSPSVNLGFTDTDVANWDTAYGWGNWTTGVDKSFVDALNIDAATLDGLDSTDLLKLDQTTPQTIINGIPLLDAALTDFDNPLQIPNKRYVDNAISFIQDFYFNNTADGIGGIYYQMTDSDLAEGTSTLTKSALGTGDDQALFNFITANSLSVESLSSGIYDITIVANKNSTGTKPTKIYAELYTRTSGGTETLRGTSIISPYLDDVITAYTLTISVPTTVTIAATDKLVVKFYANVEAAGGDATVNLQLENDYNSRISVPMESAVLSQIYLRQDGTKGLTANWDAGAFDITAQSFITAGGNSGNWNTAYGWGDHSGAYLPIGGGTIDADGRITFGGNIETFVGESTTTLQLGGKTTITSYINNSAIINLTIDALAPQTGVTSLDLGTSGIPFDNIYGTNFHGGGANITGVDAANLGGQNSAYHLAWANFTGTPTTLGGYGITDAGDMLLASVQSVTGLKTFDKDKLAMKGTSTGVTTVSTANTGASNYTLTLPAITDTVVTKTSTDTLTNKRITKRIATTDAPGATPTTNTDNVDIQTFTGLATAITSMTTNLSGTPVDGDKLEFRFKDDGTARAITWGASFASSGTVTLPTTTVASTVLRVGFEYSTITGENAWICIAKA